MTLCALQSPSVDDGAASRHVLSRLRRPECSLASWSRTVPSHVMRSLAEWAERDAAPIERTLHSPSDFLASALFGLPRAARGWIEADVRHLLQVLFEVASPHAVALKLGVIRTDQCRKFHVDYLRYRLITTYVGPATQWVPNEYVERAVLAEPPEDPQLANSLIVRHPRAVRQAAVGDVLLMKGAKHEHGLGLVHRSPPVEQTGETRVVLVLSTRDRC